MAHGVGTTLLQVSSNIMPSTFLTYLITSPNDVEQMANQEKRMPNQKAQSATVGPTLS
jgi:hypothetical protein